MSAYLVATFLVVVMNVGLSEQLSVSKLDYNGFDTQQSIQVIQILKIISFTDFFMLLLAQKFCNGGVGPYTLQCFKKTGVVVRYANIMFVYRNDGNKYCEANTVRNVSETLYNFQRYCDMSKDTSYCTLDSNFIRSVFQTQELANDQYYPVRMELKFDCLGMKLAFL
jgi:hypothetical protein